jgi:hypothetical protein
LFSPEGIPARRRRAAPYCPRMIAAHMLIYPGFFAVTFHELESIMIPFAC